MAQKKLFYRCDGCDIGIFTHDIGWPAEWEVRWFGKHEKRFRCKICKEIADKAVRDSLEERSKKRKKYAVRPTSKEAIKNANKNPG